jgi:methylglyoxal synthase
MITSLRRPRIGMVAHDSKKADLIDWARFNLGILEGCEIISTGTTGAMLATELGLNVHRLHSGPLGGDQQMGALISESGLDMLVFFWDPLESQPHDTDVKALLRIAVVWNIPVACNRASADFMVSSPLMGSDYERQLPDYAAHNERQITPAIPVGTGSSE